MRKKVKLPLAIAIVLLVPTDDRLIYAVCQASIAPGQNQNIAWDGLAVVDVFGFLADGIINEYDYCGFYSPGFQPYEFPVIVNFPIPQGNGYVYEWSGPSPEGGICGSADGFHAPGNAALSVWPDEPGCGSIAPWKLGAHEAGHWIGLDHNYPPNFECAGTLMARYAFQVGTVKAFECSKFDEVFLTCFERGVCP